MFCDEADAAVAINSLDVATNSEPHEVGCSADVSQLLTGQHT